MKRIRSIHRKHSPLVGTISVLLLLALLENVFSFLQPSILHQRNVNVPPNFSRKDVYRIRMTKPSRRSTLQSSTFAEPTSSESTATTTTVDTKKNRHHNKKRPFHHRQPTNNLKIMFRTAQELERKGQWSQARDMLVKILEKHPKDSHSHLALARLEAKRERKRRISVSPQSPSSSTSSPSQLTSTIITNATSTRTAQKAFERGTEVCPDSVHLWQAWALYEESYGNIDRAEQLYEKALELDPFNPYVCHAFGLMQKKLGNWHRAQILWEQPLNGFTVHDTVECKNSTTRTKASSTAALVCSLGELFIAQKELTKARNLYQTHLKLRRLKTERERTEVCLAAAWLEEKYFSNFNGAHSLITLALRTNPTSSVAQVAMARLAGRRRQKQKGGEGRVATVRKLAQVCSKIEDEDLANRPKDGRVFNAWAKLEVRSRNFTEARNILQRGIQRYPRDYSLLQAAGKVEERVGNYTGARDLYSASLSIEPSAPTLVAYAMLELNRPETKTVNFTAVKQLFEEALLLDPRHGPAYNAYGNAEIKQGNIEEARRIFKRGINANCSDSASIYHGFGKLELSLGNVDIAREILLRGWKETRLRGIGMDSPHRARAQFLSHTLGMLELNSNRPLEALEIFRDGIDRFGNSSQLLLGAALCESRLGKDDSARSYFEMSVLADKKHAHAWQAWGVMEMKAGNFSTAKTLFECGMKSAPTHGALYQAYGTMETRLGNNTKARMIFAAGVKKASHHVSLYQSWASLELREGNVSAARRLITEGLTRNKRNGMGWLIAAQIEKNHGNDGLVGLILRRGIECSPAYAELYRALGEYMVGRGKYNDAREIFEKGMEVDPLHAPLYHSLAELEARVCNLDGLSILHKKAAKLFNHNALAPPPSSSQAWGKKIRAGRTRDVPQGVAALAQKIVDDEGGSASLIEDLDPNTAFENMRDIDDKLVGDLIEDELVGDLLTMESIQEKNSLE